VAAASEPFNLEGRVAVITGAATGIGLATAQRFRAYGMKLALADNDETELTAVVRELGGTRPDEVLGVPTDVSRLADVERLRDQTWQRLGPASVLMNNAGTGLGGGPWERYEEWKRVIDVNLWGVIHGARLAAYRRMARQGHGHIVNVASLAGLLGSPLMTAYSMTKSGVVMFSRMLRSEGEELGVKVSVVCPSFIQTGIFEASRYAAVDKEKAIGQVPFPVMPLAPAVERIVAGVERNEAVIVFPFHARFLWRLLRWLPWLSKPLERKALRDFRTIRKAV